MLKTIKNLLLFYRIKDWFYIIGLAYLGYFYNSTQIYFIDIFLLTIISGLYLSQGYAINNYFDVNIDSPSKNILVTKKLRKNQVIVPIILNLILLFITSFFFNKQIFILVLSGTIISILYSSLRLKTILFTRLFLNTLGYSVLFVIGYAANHLDLFIAWPIYIIIFFIMLIVELIHLVTKKKKGGLEVIVNIKTLYFTYDLTSVCFLIYLIYLYIIFIQTRIITLITLLFIITLHFIMKNDKKLNHRVTKTRIKVKVVCLLYGLFLMLCFFLQ